MATWGVLFDKTTSETCDSGVLSLAQFLAPDQLKLPIRPRVITRAEESEVYCATEAVIAKARYVDMRGLALAMAVEIEGDGIYLPTGRSLAGPMLRALIDYPADGGAIGVYGYNGKLALWVDFYTVPGVPMIHANEIGHVKALSNPDDDQRAIYLTLHNRYPWLVAEAQ